MSFPPISAVVHDAPGACYVGVGVVFPPGPGDVADREEYARRFKRVGLWMTARLCLRGNSITISDMRRLYALEG
jgi:hypothetical protein